MPKTREQKEDILQELSSQLNEDKGVVFVDYRGLSVGDITKLRREVREAGGTFKVAKKTLLSRVLADKGIDIDLKSLEGQLGAIFLREDPVAPLQSAYRFSKQTANLSILGGYLEHAVQDAARMVAIAQLPSRTELLGQLTGTVAAPMTGLATVLNGTLKGLLVALSAISEKQQ